MLSDLCFTNVLVYIDDILIMNSTFKEPLVTVLKVLTTLMKGGIKIKID
jgi:hypothetical protein